MRRAGLIDFVPPTGFVCRVDRVYSSALSKSISLRLPSRIFGLGFIHQSPEGGGETDTLRLRRVLGPYFMYGRFALDEGGTIEGYYSQRIGARGQFSVSSLFDRVLESLGRGATGSAGQSRSHFQWDFGRVTLASSYCTFGQIVGMQFLTHSRGERTVVDRVDGEDASSAGTLTTVNFGGEVYYTAQERSGGVSVGVRLRRTLRDPQLQHLPLIITLTGNPLMGHYRSTLTTPFLSPRVTVSTRYDVNVNSFDSDLAVGAAYCAPEGQALRVSLSGKNGLSFVIQTQIAAAVKIRFGLKTGPLFWDRVRHGGTHAESATETETGASLGAHSRHCRVLSPAAFGIDVAICS